MKNKLEPAIRFDEFEAEWIEKQYGEIYSFYSTNSLSRDNLNYQFFNIKNIHYGDIHTKFSTCFDIEKEHVPYINLDVDLSRFKEENFCKEGDLVIADASEDYNDIGKTIEIHNLNKEKVVAGLHTFLARPNKFKMELGFSGYLVQTWLVRKQIMVIAQGTKVLGLSMGRLSKVNLNLPSLPEQKKIASFLTSVDKKIQQLSKKVELLKEYKKGVMQKIFSLELRFKDKNGNDFPDWEEKRLGEVFSRKTKKNEINNQNVLTISAQLGLINQEKYFKKSVSAKDVTGYYLLQRNDFAYNKSYSKGYPLGAIKRLTQFDQGVVSTLYICFNIVSKNDIDFYEQYFESGSLNHKIHKIAQEGARNHGLLNVSVVEFFKDISVPRPNLIEQKKIGAYLRSIDLKIAQVNKQLEQTQKFKKGLLQQMFV